MPSSGLNSLQRTLVPWRPWPRAKDRGEAGVSLSWGFWNLIPPALQSLFLRDAPADSLESASAQKAPLSERCLSTLSPLHSAVFPEPADPAGWCQLGQKAARCQPASSSATTSKEAPGEPGRPRCSLRCLPAGASSMAHRKTPWLYSYNTQ